MMGTDNLFHKKKERKASLLRRRRAMKDPYDVILIVCEGGKTEPDYFDELKRAFRLSSANVRVCGIGADPLTVVNFAIKTFRREPEFDRIYCVFATFEGQSSDNHPLPVVRVQTACGTNGTSGRSGTSGPGHEE